MVKKEFVDYKEFLQFAYKNKNKIISFKYYDNHLYSFKTNNLNCKFLYNNGVLTPNKFVSLLGFENYNAFIHKKFSKLKEYAKTKQDAQKWYNGYFGGLVGINKDIVNNYIGFGEVNDFYDYDINKAYLYQLTQFIPTKFISEMTVEDFNKLTEMEKMPYFYFFEIELKTIQGKFLKAIGHIKSVYRSFDFLNTKQNEKMVVSEKRLNLINQIYFNDYVIKKVYVFAKGKYKFYENILNRYCELKNNYGAEFKKNALRLYGTLGQINKTIPTKFDFDADGNLMVFYKHELNFDAMPQVSMWVADSVALMLFDIISNHLDSVICWNTDGLTSLKPLGLQVSKQCGRWKLKKIKAIPFLFNETGARLFFKDIETNEIYGANNIVEQDNKFFEMVEISKSNLNNGFVIEKRLYEIKKDLIFDNNKTFRNQIIRENFREEIIREYEKF